MASSAYLDVRNAIADEGSDARVEVNQRALIDKILARYASAGAVYRELLQNSNDADATTAEILITTSTSSEGGKEVVSQVIYRNNGLPFRTQDWARLRKIAEGNPDASKVGAFGVGAYTMFSICEEPLVVSGKKGEEEAMAFFWKGDSLWTKTGKAPDGIINMSATLNNSNVQDNTAWTSFMLPSRDPYPLPDLVEFAKFLTASLTFTQCLKNIRVYVNSTLQLNIQKTIIESHTIETPKASSFWRNDGAVTSSSSGMFTLGKGADLTQTSVQMSVSIRKDLSPKSDMETSKVRARYASAMVNTKIPSGIEKRMMRVTKKKPPKELTVQIFLDAADHSDDNQKSSKLKRKSKAALVTQSFAPTSGSGRIFIGFRTSQTTGLGIHLAAPLVPTVEREAIDFVDPALRDFNSELLEVSGILMRLALENEMYRLGTNWNWKEEREAWEAQREDRKKQQKEEEEEKKLETDDVESTKDSSDDKSSISSSLYSFATFMARGVTSTVKEAVKAVPELLGEDSETTELLNPIDDRPLSIAERDAIILMKAYCPRQSTPDALVGQCLAKGFGRCMASSSPPVLTVDGVARGTDSRLTNNGMEAFGIPHAVRRIMLENAREYHTVIANCPTMSIDDLIKAMKENILGEEMLVRLLKWYPKYARLNNPRRDKSLRLKEVIRYHKENYSKGGQSSDAEAEVHQLDSIFYFAPQRMSKKLPLPETVFPQSLVGSIGLRTLEDRHFNDWFQPLPFDIWTGFISEHTCMRNGNEKDDAMRILVLVTLSKHFDSLESATAKRRFVELLPLSSPCLPFDITTSDVNLSASNTKTAVPNELYLPDTDLSAFSGLQTFYKASKRLKKEGVSDAFLLAMGVRKTIKIEFLFLHLDTLNWNENPKPLIRYLIDADLSQQDLLKLRSTRYLPAANDKTTVYAPSQLYFKDKDLNIFPFVKFLQWPSNESMSTAARNFLLKLGLRTEPPLSDIMGYLEKESAKSVDSRDDAALTAALQYLTQRLGPRGAYVSQFRHAKVDFLPCIRQNLETGEIVKEIKSPSTCYFNPTAMVMGFNVLDPMLSDTEQIGLRMNINRDPSCQVLLRRLLQLVDISTARLDQLERQGTGIEAKEKNIEKILALFEGVFLYLSSRTSDFQKRHLSELAKKPFIPCKCRSGLQFYTADQVFFLKRQSEGAGGGGGDSIAELLFQQVEYNAFLSFAGVKTEPSLEELFALMMEKPDEVLDSLGEPKYKMLLRRIAANPPFKRITADIRSSPFLLGYLIVDEDESEEGDETKARSKAQYLLAKADDIHIVDNAFLRRQFPMLISPMEQTLEEFYRRIGSKYVSEVVKKDFEVMGNTHRGTPLANSCADRIKERRPLLLSPSITSRPLVSNASSILDNLEIFQADSIRAIYSFERSSKMINVTCCSKVTKRKNIAIFITNNFEIFDLGNTIGDLILQHCELKDAFFLTSLLEASIGTLRNRGFPVDRIVKPQPPAIEVKAEPRKQTPDITNSQKSPAKSRQSSVNGTVKDGSVDAASSNPTQPSGGFDTILKSMYPQYDTNKIREMLGPNPSKEKAAEVANELAEEVNKGVAGSEHENAKGPGNDAESMPRAKKEKKSVLGKMREGLNPVRGLGGKMPQMLNKRIGGSCPPQGVGAGVGVDGQGNNGESQRVGRGVGAGQGDDAESKGQEDAVQKSLEAMLQQSVESSRSVNSAGVASQETLLQNLPEGIDCNSNGCEVVPAQNIRPFKGPYGNYNSRNGIRVMAAVTSTSTANEAFGFLSSNFDAVDNFSVVIGHLVQIFKLKISSVAIYYDPNGNTIAFNSNKAFHFNLRFFHALHRHDWNSKGCYSYWFTVFCHELAHNLVSAHNKEHGKYTESIVMLYLPALIDFLAQNGIA